MAAPPDLPTAVHSVAETAGLVEDWTSSKKITLIIIKSPTVIEDLLQYGVTIQKVNVGGIHYREDRKEYLPYIYLSKSEIKIFKKLMSKGINFECREVPTAHAYNLEKLLKRK